MTLNGVWGGFAKGLPQRRVALSLLCTSVSLACGGDHGTQPTYVTPTQLAFTVQPINASAGAAFTPSIQVTAQDAGGNTATGYTGAISVTLGTNPGGGTLVGTLTKSAVAGIATFADLHIDKADIGYTLKATATNMTGATSSSFNVTADGATNLTLAGGNSQTDTIGAMLATPYTVRVTDAFSNPVAGVIVTWAVTGGGGSITPGSPTNSGGIADATRILGNTVGANVQTASATVSGLNGSLVTFTATAKSGNATNVRFTTQPSSTLVGVAITPAVVVTAFDRFSDTAAAFTGNVTVSIGTNPNAATLSGTLTQAAMAGKATFYDLSIGSTGSGYTLLASASGLTGATSNPFDVVCGNCWTVRDSMPTARYSPGIGVVNGIIYAVGGQTGTALSAVEAYDPVLNSWITKASMPTPRTYLGVGVVSGILYAVGGYDPNGQQVFATVEAYDPVANTWSTKKSMPRPRYGLAVGVINGVLYAVGGDSTGGSFLATVEAYDPVSDTWTTKASLPIGRDLLGAGVVNGTLFAVGGRVAAGVTGDVEAYNPGTDSWTVKNSMPTARYGLGIGVVNNLIYAVGGNTVTSGLSLLGTLEVYDPALNSWVAKASMHNPRNLLGVGAVNGLVYAAGGENTTGLVSGTLEAYRP